MEIIPNAQQHSSSEQLPSSSQQPRRDGKWNNSNNNKKRKFQNFKSTNQRNGGEGTGAGGDGQVQESTERQNFPQKRRKSFHNKKKGNLENI